MKAEIIVKNGIDRTIVIEHKERTEEEMLLMISKLVKEIKAKDYTIVSIGL